MAKNSKSAPIQASDDTSTDETESHEDRVARLKADLDEAAIERFNGRDNMTRHKKALEAYETALRG